MIKSLNGDKSFKNLFLSYQLLLLVCFSNIACSQNRSYRDIYPDTWVATDAIGRTMPNYDSVGPIKKDQPRVVSIFYITWHSDDRASWPAPYRSDVTKILAADPNARFEAQNPLWQDGQHHWGQPELGYFLSRDEYVIQKDMSMFADAGVDVLVVDVTNAVFYWDEWQTLFSTMQKFKAQGNKTPKFCFWAFNGPAITVVQQLYDKVYKKEKYKDLWFYWDGKPLLLYNSNPAVEASGSNPQNINPHYDPDAATNPNHPNYGDPDYTEKVYKDYTREVKDFFTLRTMWWGYYEWAGKRFIGTEDNWTFGYDMHDERVKAMTPDQLIATHNGKLEQAAVTPAQHPTSMVGKSWSVQYGPPELNEYDLPAPTYVPWLGKTVKNPEGYGIYFQERWEDALKSDPPFLYINDWNEWTADKFHPGDLNTAKGKPIQWMGRQSPYCFIDQYNSEYNRGVQPMKGGYTDNYYMQMAQNIRRYKGIRPIPEIKGFYTIKIDANFKDWQKNKVEYRDTIGDTIKRNYPGYGGIHYKNNSGRNDIITSKVAVDDNNIYFYAQTNNPLTSHTDKNWMLLLINADKDHNTGWFGYDYLINKEIIDQSTTTLMEYKENQWTKKAELNFSYSKKQLELAIPRKLLDLTSDNFSFDFHWADNPKELKDPISLCTHGDSAPNRRFNYRCIWKK